MFYPKAPEICIQLLVQSTDIGRIVGEKHQQWHGMYLYVLSKSTKNVFFIVGEKH